MNELDRGNRVRLVLFGSFYRGYYLLHEFLHGASSRLVEVVGVVTDDPKQSFVSPGRRLWGYPHAEFEESMVTELAKRNGVAVYSGRIKSDEFRKIYREQWYPDIALSGTFGQLLDESIYGFPRLGTFNTHPCIGRDWPSPYAGPNPFQMMIDEKVDFFNIALHEINGEFDAGRMIALSDNIALPPGIGVIDLHKISGPLVARFVAEQLPSLLRCEIEVS